MRVENQDDHWEITEEALEEEIEMWVEWLAGEAEDAMRRKGDACGHFVARLGHLTPLVELQAARGVQHVEQMMAEVCVIVEY